MEGNVYTIVQIAFIVAALLAFRGGHLWPGIIFAALAGWTYYSHETGTSFQDIKSEINQAVDESAHKKYEQGIKSNYELNGTVKK